MNDPNVFVLEQKLLRQMYPTLLPGFGDPNIAADLTGGLNIGRSMEDISSSFPNEFEFYAIALELIDGEGKTKKFFSFPVMPNSITMPRQFNTSIQKTMGGVVVQTNPTFVPFDITLNGNFGRKFRRMISHNSVSNSAVKSNGEGATVTDSHVFSADYKTGYGATKLLEDILILATRLDENGLPYRLLMYNLSFNQKYMVEPMAFTPNMSREANRIWHYSLALKAVAPAEAIVSKDRLKGSIHKMLDFSKKNRDFVNQVDKIATLGVNGVNVGTSYVEAIMAKVTNGTAPTITDSTTAPNAFKAVRNLIQNTDSIDGFSVNAGRKLINGH